MSDKRNRGLRAEAMMLDEKVVESTTVEESKVESEDVAEETVENISEKIRGIVKCIRLNVRKEPRIEDGNVVGSIKAGEKVTIYPNNSTSLWYKVCTDSGLSGYCLKDRIEIEQ